MRAFKVLSDPKAFQLIGDETRRKILFLLRAKEYTVSQIASELDKTPQAIYHHIAKMKEAGMIEVAREERVDHFIETYYQASAEVFEFHHGSDAVSAEYAKKATKEALEHLPKLGLMAPTDDASVTRLVELMTEMKCCGLRKEMEDKVVGMENVGFMTKQDLTQYARVISMSEKELAKYERLQKEFHALLRSRAKREIPA